MHQCMMYLDSNNFHCSTNINTVSLFFPFFSIDEQLKTNNELGEMKGIFYQNPLIMVFLFTDGTTSSMSVCLHSVRLSLSSSLLLFQ